jgi:hypothetical protein
MGGKRNVPGPTAAVGTTVDQEELQIMTSKEEELMTREKRRSS